MCSEVFRGLARQVPVQAGLERRGGVAWRRRMHECVVEDQHIHQGLQLSRHVALVHHVVAVFDIMRLKAMVARELGALRCADVVGVHQLACPISAGQDGREAGGGRVGAGYVVWVKVAVHGQAGVGDEGFIL